METNNLNKNIQAVNEIDDAYDPEQKMKYNLQRSKDLATFTNLYPHNFKRTCEIVVYRQKYDVLKTNENLLDIVESITGRIQTIRTSSNKLYFISIESDGAFLQVLANARFYQNIDEFKNDKSKLARGDIIGITGHPARSTTGELSILPTRIILLAPCLHLIPKNAKTFTDDGLRFKQRYLDFILHPENRNIFKVRAKVNNFLRTYLDELGFIEVETPIVSAKVGGANAKPFITHHNDSGKDMYMRIAPELYLKQLVVGGFEKVYELGKQFRNESCNYDHNVEFTSIEIYQAYSDYYDMMRMTEDLLSKLVITLFGSYIIKYDVVDNLSGNMRTVEIDFTPPFKKINLINDLEKVAKFTFPQEILQDLGSENSRQFLIKICDERNVICNEPKTTPRLLDKLVGEYLEPLSDNPTFIMNHPQIMSPLAKYHRENPIITERFELFILGREYANAYTELNNPMVQEICFRKQANDKKMGDSEAQILDRDYVTALEYGLMPTGGLGIGIDRLIMLLTNKSSIKEVITFKTN